MSGLCDGDGIFKDCHGCTEMRPLFREFFFDEAVPRFTGDKFTRASRIQPFTGVAKESGLLSCHQRWFSYRLFLFVSGKFMIACTVHTAPLTAASVQGNHPIKCNVTNAVTATVRYSWCRIHGQKKRLWESGAEEGSCHFANGA